MSLLIRGSTFWGEFNVNGKRVRLSLDVKVQGTVPKPLSEPSDRFFEQARLKAWAAHDELQKELTDPARSVRRLEKIEEIVTGEANTVIAPADMYRLWFEAPRKKKLQSTRHQDQVKALLDEFVAFLVRRHPGIRDIRQISYTTALAFMREAPEAMMAKTWDNRLISMRAAFNAAAAHTRVKENPFRRIPKRDEGDSRAVPPPYDTSELACILKAAGESEIVGPVVITAMCTGLRRADCALLRWEKVDLAAGMIQCTAHKTGEALLIPILPPLRAVLEKLPERKGLCFRAAAKIFEENPDGLNLLLKKLLQSAGMPVKSIAEADGKTRLRGRTDCGFHRFKSTFVTLALSAGVSVELLQKVVGNKDVRVLLKHYHRPAGETIRRELSAKLPEVLGGETAPRTSWIQQLRTLISSADAVNLTQVKAKALALVDAQLGDVKCLHSHP